jgi:hypothetical protein
MTRKRGGRPPARGRVLRPRRAEHLAQILYIVKLRTGTDLRFWRVDADGSARPGW